MSEQLLAVLRIGLLGLLYLFFLRVLHAVWVEVHGPRRARRARSVTTGAVVAPVAPAGIAPPPAPPRSSAPLTVRVVEPAAWAGRSVALHDVITIGRAPSCELPLDDTYVSQQHARILRDARGAIVEDLHSTNGTYVNRVKVAGPTPFGPGDRLQIGNVVLELA